MKLTALRTKCYGDHATVEAPQIAHLQWHAGYLNSWWIKLEPGVTGYESASVASILSDILPGSWCACAGTEGSWDKLVVPASEMERLRDALRLIAPVLELVGSHESLLTTIAATEEKPCDNATT